MKFFTRRQNKSLNYFLKEKEQRKKARMEQVLHRSPTGDSRKRESIVRIMSRQVDQMLIVTSFVLPPLKTGLIDRFLVMAEIEKVKPLIIFNKVDLLDSRDRGETIAGFYRSLGYPALLTSVVTGEGIEMLIGAISGKQSLLAGHSGVGKSSLLNLIEPGLVAKAETGEVSSATRKGRHTTTSTKLYRLSNGSVIFDLPGIKHIALHDIDSRAVERCFPEFIPYACYCKFADCLHKNENSCGVQQGLSAGEISRERYQSYLRILENP